MSVLLLLVSALVLIYLGIGGTTAAAVMTLATVVGLFQDEWHLASLLFGGVFLALALILVLPGDLRLDKLSRPLLGWVRSRLPKLSDTEQEALKSGTVDWDGELFSGQPDWHKLLDAKPAHLTSEEQAFLDGPVEKLCAMLDDWKITHEHYDLPDKVWKFMRDQGFFGLIIPKEFGGLGFSHTAHSEIVMKISTRSVSAAVTVMVPNSLGPGELLMQYGTDDQKQHYLPRLAKGDEIPCFALTSPVAGSDAGAIPDKGIVCKGTWEGKEVLGLKVTWNKRYITLAPVATLIGLAFDLRDPDGLLGDDPHPGITCALVPADTPGVEVGARHDPLGIPFPNGPVRGRDVFVPVDAIIGGPAMAGQGWPMLMECLAAGRALTLPAIACAGTQGMLRYVAAYASVREQFGTPIGRFAGIEEPLARIAGQNYMVDAARVLTAQAIDAGHKPAVLSAILKWSATEAMREVAADAMDVTGGAGIMRGPRNVAGRAHLAAPIGITVEGANILTRTLIVYGQGAIRCHPFVRDEMEALATGDVERLDRALCGHLGHALGNALRALAGGLVRPRPPSPLRGPHRQVLGELDRLSAAFATLSDLCMVLLGGRLKFAQALTGRLADALANLYLGAATLKRYQDRGQLTLDASAAEWAARLAAHRAEEALLGVLRNLPAWPLGALARAWLFPLGRRCPPPSDQLGRQLAREVLDDGPARRAHSPDIYEVDPDELGLGVLEQALQAAVRARGPRRRLARAVRAGRLAREPRADLAARGAAAGVITADEARAVTDAARLRREAMRVDEVDGPR